MKLWYEQPAKDWNEALPIGNGRLGGMIFGKTDLEIISLNEDTLWSGYPKNINPQNKSTFLKEARKLALDRKYHDAQVIIEDELTAYWGQSYLPLGDLLIDLKHKGEISDYRRNLDLSTAVAATEYTIDGVKYKREVFATAVDDVIAVKFYADKPGSISFSLGMSCQLNSKVYTESEYLILGGDAPSNVEPSYIKDVENPVIYSDKPEERGMQFIAAAKVLAVGGRVTYKETKIEVENVDSALVIFNAQTSFNGFNVHPFLNGKEYKLLCKAGLEKVTSKSYESLLSDHIADYKTYFDRVELDIGKSEAEKLPTDKRLKAFINGKNDPSLYTLLFQYGRYLLIASSRPGSQPANLQGIWNKELRAPWSSNYTLNINIQMNYWPALSCGLREFHEPLVRLIEELYVNGEVTAQETYGVKGFAAHHNTDLWRFTWPVGNHRKGSAGYAYWNMSAGWLCRHLFEQYEYTLDREYLKNRAYPVMKSAAEFLLNMLTENKEGQLGICPSTSPENSFIADGKTTSVSETTTMTMSIVKELFNNCIRSCELLGIDEEFSNELKSKLGKLFPYKIGSKGQLLEWNEEFEESDLHHRHISHLYALHPSTDITLEDTPELAEACKVSLNIRGDEATGWGLGWRVNQWARLFDGDRALALLNQQLRVVDESDINYSGGGGTYLNLFDAHPPFQIDGNFASTAGIAEMLMQSRNNKIFILPALPVSWREGHVKGLCAKCGITVNIEWDKGYVCTELLSEIDQSIKLAIKGIQLFDVELKAGVVYRYTIITNEYT